MREGELQARPLRREMHALADRRRAAVQLAQLEDERIEEIEEHYWRAEAEE